MKSDKIANPSDLGAILVRACQQQRSAGGVLPEAISVGPIQHFTMPVQYDWSTKSMTISDRVSSTILAEMARQLQPDGSATWSSTHPLHLLYHALSQCELHHQMGDDAYCALQRQRWEHKQWWRHGRTRVDSDESLARQVSGYAATAPGAFVGEFRAARMAGRRFSPQIMDLYHKLIGQQYNP